MVCSVLIEEDLSQEQSRALDIGKNVALKAGAGSGKTRVLTKRYIKLLNDVTDIKIDNIVAITFTRKAAAEMKERIRKEIESLCKSDKDGKKWTVFRDSLIFANIDTIHGFCEKMIRDNFVETSVDPTFSIMDEAEVSTAVKKMVEIVTGEVINDEKNKYMLATALKKYPSKIFTGKMFQSEVISLYFRMKEAGLSVEDIKLSYESDESTKAMENLALIILEKIEENYKAFKSSKNLLDFNDLETIALKLLSNDIIRNDYFERYRYILVDEFQDTNRLQKEIILKLTEKDGKIPDGKLFIVGDIKQSIYGFRGTDFRIFDEFCRKIEADGKVLNLSNCYRSTKNIISTINDVFKNLIEPYEELKYQSFADEGPKVELITYKKDDIVNEKNERYKKIKQLLKDDDNKGKLNELLMEDGALANSRKDFQGKIIAGRILKLVGEGFEYKDIAVLLRSRSSLKSIEGALADCGIPYCIIGGIGFWDKREIIDIISVYKLAFDTSDEIALLTALRSPIFGFSDDDLFAFMNIYNGQCIDDPLEALKNFSPKCGDDKWVIKRACNILDKISKMRGVYNPYEIFKMILKITEYKKLLISLPNGYQKFRNVEKLESIIKSFEEKRILDSKDLIEYLDALKESSSLDSEAFLDTEESNAVKIMTIHSSKGLEFDAVIIPDMDKATDGISVRKAPLFMLSEEGYIFCIGVNDDGDLDKSENSLYKEEYDRYLEKENMESRRLFYVASTRAKKFLAFIGQMKDNIDDIDEDSKLNSFMKQLLFAIKDGCSNIDYIDGTCLQSYAKNKLDYVKELNEDADKIKFGGLIDKMPLNVKGNVSVTAYIDYLTCPMFYYYKYIVSLTDEYVELDGNSDDIYSESDDKISALERGTIVHKILETLDDDDYIDVSNLNDEIIKRYIDNYYMLRDKHRKKISGRLLKRLKEYKFRAPIDDNINLNGVIDRIDIYENDGNIESYIFDYKTNKIDSDDDLEKIARHYTPQIHVYSHVLRRLKTISGFSPTLKGAFLYFLDVGKYVEVDISDLYIMETLEKILKATPFLLGAKGIEEYVSRKREYCSMCLYNKICR
ncbi:UvrD/REP helicase [Thermoanaerobacterium xylanolyticum LX-11]|uniref:DNA 3'-5' helicase n=1 Tax=Thermoanaerobacterium xylanolyticum (strain ATCC 49914 / DSM 7097 / LX-11) TaxID=858215 RepID=F6BIY7_THEXL|nr:UvrD/REP helicase [Thermoanaerobacterium xylanolyticum LX-11]